MSSLAEYQLARWHILLKVVSLAQELATPPLPNESQSHREKIPPPPGMHAASKQAINTRVQLETCLAALVVIKKKMAAKQPQ